MHVPLSFLEMKFYTPRRRSGNNNNNNNISDVSTEWDTKDAEFLVSFCLQIYVELKVTENAWIKWIASGKELFYMGSKT